VNRLPLDRVQPGMVLAADVKRDDGVLLCGRGAPVTENLLKSLKRLGFETVAVDEGALESDAWRAERIARQTRAIERRFAKTASDPILAELKNALIRRLENS
jgi:hypothetical protein